MILRKLGQQNYLQTWQAMRDFTDQRTAETVDELWVVEHYPVFTQGLAGDPAHIHQRNHIPLIQTDRGGQVTYHGLGQLVFYPLLQLNRYRLGVKQLVHILEEVTLSLLQEHHIMAKRHEGAPGLYVGKDKIAALGLKIRKGCSYHGLSLNVDMDKTPYQQITPCGLQNIGVTQWRDHAPLIAKEVIVERWHQLFTAALNHAASTRI